MTKSSSLPEILFNAYIQCQYWVFARHQYLLQIADHSPQAQLLSADLGCRQGAIISAYNPCSKRLSETQNQRRHRQLVMDISALHYPFYRSINRDPNQVWPDENGVFVVNILRCQALEVAQKYGQNAFVWVSGAQVELVICASPSGANLAT